MKNRIAAALLFLTTLTMAAAPQWPAVKNTMKPWVYWWWMGSAVDEQNLTYSLQSYADVGFGGVHVIPIYGVRGQEAKFIPYLSPAWLDKLAYTVREARRFDLGVDMTAGTGWPYGGPWVTQSDAAVLWRMEKFPARAVSLTKEWKIVAIDSSKQDGWYVLSEKPSGMKVKRAAPGGEGLVIDYLSTNAVQRYFAKFDEAFRYYRGPFPRAFYHDSFESSGCNGTDDFLQEFRLRRGYDLTDHLEALYGDGEPDAAGRVRCDYRETISDLLLERFTIPWVSWAHRYKMLTRNQAHGSPGNLLDLYAAADVPETEAFGSSLMPIPGLRIDTTVFRNFGKPDRLVNKFASSAAHVSGRKLVSSESCTWLAEHFQISLSQVKPEIDRLFISGINHIFFHGMSYSPREAAYPGWMFYASTQFDSFNPFWRDLPELNHYIARCQSLLQAGDPDPDVLLYFPIHDLWTKKITTRENQLRLTVHNAEVWLYQSPFHDTARWLDEQGFTFDYISDRQLQEVKVRKGVLQTPGCKAKVLLIPGCEYMPLATLRQIADLTKNGASVVFLNVLPKDLPGLGTTGKQRAEWQNCQRQLPPASHDLASVLQQAGVQPEPFARLGLAFERRFDQDRWIYFVANLSSKPVSQGVTLARSCQAVEYMNPLNGEIAALPVQADGRVSISLQPGQSCILRTCKTIPTLAAKIQWRVADAGLLLAGPWQVRFGKGEPPVTPDSLTIDRLASWTDWPVQNAQSFAGEVEYTCTLVKPEQKAGRWLLDLGQVCESARVSVNGKEVATAWSIPFVCEIEDALLSIGKNQLTIKVVNLAANRIADMDRRGVPWKIFYDANIVGTNYKPFDASHWSPKPSGLMGPVRLLPMTALTEALK
jgi:hypothetical protein